MAKDINQTEFTAETILRQEISMDYFREWFAIFLNHQSIEQLYIYDFFAGSGKDIEENFGTPLLFLEKAIPFCDVARKNRKLVSFYFNELEQHKREILTNNVRKYMGECGYEKCSNKICIFDFENYSQFEFKELFYSDRFNIILNNSNYAKFILLDQYGYSQIDKDIFLQLVNAPKTDFIFFISSSFVRRFKDSEQVKKYFDAEKIDFNETMPHNCHRIIANYYRSLIPQNKEYYIHHFTIKKGSNYWGLVFGTNHTLGMEKFLQVCWKKDKHSGEANFNINYDFDEKDWPYDKTETIKTQTVHIYLENLVLSGRITDNISGMKQAMKYGCLPALFNNVVKHLEEKGKIKMIGEMNYQSTNIHNIPQYQFSLI